MTARRSHLEQLTRAVGRGGARPVGTDEARSHCFLCVYGVDHRESVRLGWLALNHYLPVFRIRQPDDQDRAAFVYQVNLWLAGELALDADAAPPGLLRELPRRAPAPGNLNGERSLQGALDAMRALLSEYASEELLRAAATEAVIWGSIAQRQENAWAADDPAAYLAAERERERVEAAMLLERLEDRRCARSDLEAVRSLLRGRRMEDNEAAIAVERREWRVVAGWLRPVVRRAPPLAEPAAHAALERWLEVGGLWGELVPRQPRPPAAGAASGDGG